MALYEDGAVAACGYDEYGQLLVPTLLANVAGAASIGANMVLWRTDGTLTGWGNRFRPPSGMSNVVEAVSQFDGGFALLKDGTVIGWGFNNPTFGVTNVAKLSMGYFMHSRCGETEP